MEETEYEKMYSLEDTYWWFQGRKSIIFTLLKRRHLLDTDGMQRIVDLGCGTGLILEELSNHIVPIGVDFSQKALTYSQRRGLEKLVCADVNELPFEDESFNLVFALDLLEHISDDNHLLLEMYRICEPGGHVLLTVPAHESLWSEHDEALHHYRRYSGEGFKKRILAAGFQPVKFSYCISFTYLPIILFRKLQKFLKPSRKPKTHLIVLPRAVNTILIELLKVEAKLLDVMNIPFGVSLICLARKKFDKDTAM